MGEESGERGLADNTLADNTILTDYDFCGEAGLLFFIETAGKKILFDTGLTEMFLTNVEKTGIGL